MLVRHVGEPFADSSLIPTYHVARIARDHVKVVLNGDGGDELFGGYPRYRAVALAGVLSGVPGLSRVLGAAAGLIAGPLLRERRLARVKRLVGGLALTPDERYQRWMGYFTGAFGDVVRGVHTSERVTPQFFASLADETGALAPVDRAMATDLLSYLPGDLLVKMDIATMAASVEARSPFLDHQLVEFMACLPGSFKVSPLRTKRLFRDAMRGILPREVIDRGKMGFGVPVGSWLRGPMRPLIDDVVLSPRAFARGYVDEKAVRGIIREHLDGVDRTPFIWALLMLELWFREVVEATIPAAEGVLAQQPLASGRPSG
jgi:asparagine synthase (glutamine-hydrolysing)